MDSVSSSVLGDSDLGELDQHLLPSSTADVHSIDVPPNLAKDLL
jgi:deubiquitinase DESI2